MWNSVNSFVKVPCLGNGKWIWSIESKSKGKSSMGSTWRWGSFAYNTIPTAEEVLNGDVDQTNVLYSLQLVINFFL